MFVSEDTIRRQELYSLLSSEQQKVAGEISEKYALTMEYVASILATKGFNQVEAEKYISQERLLWAL